MDPPTDAVTSGGAAPSTLSGPSAPDAVASGPDLEAGRELESDANGASQQPAKRARARRGPSPAASATTADAEQAVEELTREQSASERAPDESEAAAVARVEVDAARREPPAPDAAVEPGTDGSEPAPDDDAVTVPVSIEAVATADPAFVPQPAAPAPESPPAPPASLFSPAVPSAPPAAPTAPVAPTGVPEPTAFPKPAAVFASARPSAPVIDPGARVQRVGLPAGVPTAADLAAAHAAAEWDEREPRDLLAATDLLRAEVAGIVLPLEIDGVQRARREHEALLGQIDDYLLPRLRRLDAPLLAVVGGSTGAGKSTLVNSIARREVTRSGVLRPTTRSPVLVHHPYDSGAFLSQRVLPGLARVTSEAPEPAQPIEIDAPRVTALRLVPHDGVTPGLAIIDAPDIDSVVEANRDLADQLLASADLWVFVTTSARYGDAVPWQMLQQAVDRGVAVAVVLDRVPADVMQEVRTHLATLLRDRGLGTAPMFTIPETTLENGYLPHDLVAPLAGWLRRLALDVRSRDVVVRRTLIGVLDSLRDRVTIVAAAADAQADAEAVLRADVDARYDGARAELGRSLVDGSVARGEVLARWQEFIADGDVFRSLEPGGGRLVDRLLARLRGRVAPSQPVLDAVHRGLENVVLARMRATSEGLAVAWLGRSGGPALLAAAPGVAQVPDGLDERLARTLREWRTTLTDLVRQQPEVGRSGVGVLGLDGVVAVLAVLAVTARRNPDLRGPATIAGAVLGALYGEEAVEPLVAAARDDVASRVLALLDGERERALGVLDALGIRSGRGEVLLDRASVVEEAR